MEIYKRSDGRSPYWYYDIADPLAPGGRRRVSTRRTNRAEAKRVADEAARRTLDRVQLGALDELTLDEALSRYLASVQRKRDYPNIVSRAQKLLGRLRTQPNRFGLPEPFRSMSYPRGT